LWVEATTTLAEKDVHVLNRTGRQRSLQLSRAHRATPPRGTTVSVAASAYRCDLTREHLSPLGLLWLQPTSDKRPFLVPRSTHTADYVHTAKRPFSGNQSKVRLFWPITNQLNLANYGTAPSHPEPLKRSHIPSIDNSSH
jgi:nucleotidyltransferase/DNA polymerase involved in DNA repair